MANQSQLQLAFRREAMILDTGLDNRVFSGRTMAGHGRFVVRYIGSLLHFGQ